MSPAGSWDAIRLAGRIQSDLAEYSGGSAPTPSAKEEDAGVSAVLPPEAPLIEQFDRRITDPDLRAAARSRFVSLHYADAVEAGVKCLCECIRARSGRTEDGDGLMTVVFSPSNPILRINAGRSKTDESEQRGHMWLCQGVVGAWRNPRAHRILDDEPERALMMLEVVNDLIRVSKAATRTRRRRPDRG